MFASAKTVVFYGPAYEKEAKALNADESIELTKITKADLPRTIESADKALTFEIKGVKGTMMYPSIAQGYLNLPASWSLYYTTAAEKKLDKITYYFVSAANAKSQAVYTEDGSTEYTQWDNADGATEFSWVAEKDQTQQWLRIRNVQMGGFIKYITVEYSDATNGAADAFISGSDAPVQYFNLLGQPVSEPRTGLYIMKQGKKTAKVYLRK